jgi:hypothetical protein
MRLAPVIGTFRKECHLDHPLSDELVRTAAAAFSEEKRYIKKMALSMMFSE